jgi:hypothetical protein
MLEVSPSGRVQFLSFWSRLLYWMGNRRRRKVAV